MPDCVRVFLLYFPLHQVEVVELGLQQAGGGLLGDLRAARGLHECFEVFKVGGVLLNVFVVLKLGTD